MNAYLIQYKNKEYITNADNIQEAEDKFVEYLEIDYSDDNYIIGRIDITDSIRDSESIVFF